MDEAIELFAFEAVGAAEFVGEEAGGFVDVVNELRVPGCVFGMMMIDHEPVGFVEASFEAEIAHPGGAFVEGALTPVLIVEREQADFTDRGQSWHSPERFAQMEDRIRVRLAQLAARLGDADWLDGEFSAGDLMMVMVLRRADEWLLAEFPPLVAYVERGKARPAYKRAFAAQWAINGEGPVPD